LHPGLLIFNPAGWQCSRFCIFNGNEVGYGQNVFVATEVLLIKLGGNEVFAAQPLL
jgi:hypothetical protein